MWCKKNAEQLRHLIREANATIYEEDIMSNIFNRKFAFWGIYKWKTKDKREKC